MGIPTHKYLDETVMRQAFMNLEISKADFNRPTSPLLKTIIICLKRRIGSRLLPGTSYDLVKRRRRG